MKVSTVGLDLAKNIFQVHAIDDAGKVIVRRSLRRRQVMPFFGKLAPCLIGIEAFGTSHFWARELEASGTRGDGTRGRLPLGRSPASRHSDICPPSSNAAVA